MYQERRGQFELLAVATKDTKDPIGFGRREGYSYSFVRDLDGIQQYKAKVRPHTVFIDAEGNIVEIVRGGIDEQLFIALVAKIIK